MHVSRLAVAMAVLIIGGVSIMPAKASAAQQRPDYGPGQNPYAQNNSDWNAPPQDFNDVQRRGFRDGLEGARRDYGNHRQPNVDNRDEYRHPDVPRDEWRDYREGFQRGYERGMSYLTGGYNSPMQGPGPGQDFDRRDRDAQPGPGYDARRRGFEEGMEGAIKDFGNHRRPDPDNRDEFRHPPLPGELRDPFRDGFRRGYQVAMSELMNGGGDRDDAYRQQGPRGDARMRGFQDGMEGAMHDFENHRRPDPDNRDEYRHPQVPYQLQDEYRRGFERGYNVATRGLMGLPTGRRDDDDRR